MYSQGAIHFQRQNMYWYMVLIKKTFVTNHHVFMITLSWIWFSTKLSWKRKKQLPLLLTPLVLRNCGQRVVTFNFRKYLLDYFSQRLIFEWIFFLQMWILLFFAYICLCSSWNSSNFAWIYLRGCQNFYLRYKWRRKK